MSNLAAWDGFKGPMFQFWRECPDVEFVRHLERTFGPDLCAGSLSLAALTARVQVLGAVPRLEVRSAFTPLVVSIVDELDVFRAASGRGRLSAKSIQEGKSLS